MYCVHKLVLQAGSSFFAAAFSSSYTWTDETGVYRVGEVHSKTLEACLDWIYTGSCVAADDDALYAITHAANYLGIDPLVDVAKLELRKRLSPSTALSTWDLANSNNFTDLASEAAKVLSMHFKSQEVQQEWLDGNVPYALAHEILSDDMLCVESEEKVYRAVVAWVKAAPVSAEFDIKDLLGLVRFRRVSDAFCA